MKHGLTYLLLLMLVIACKPTVPSQYIQPDDMEDLLFDYHLASAMAKTGHTSEQTDFNRVKYFNAVLKKHGVTEAEFDSSLVYYYSHVDRFKEIYAEVNKRMMQETKALGASVGDLNRYSQYSSTGDTANIWKFTTEALLMPRPTMNRFDFTLKADTSFYQGDSFMLQFMSEFLWQSGSKDVVVCIVTKYVGDSIIQTMNHANVSGLSQIRIPANRERKLKEMTGFIYLSNSGDDVDARRLMFISQIQLIRFHNKQLPSPSNETIQRDSLKADSLQRSHHPGGPMPDSARRGNISDLRSQPLPAPSRAPLHRVAPGPGVPKK